MTIRRHTLRRKRFGIILIDNGGWMTAAMIAEQMRAHGWIYGNISAISQSLRGSEGIRKLHMERKLWFKMGHEAGYRNWLKRK